MSISEKYLKTLNRLGKWRMVFASWQLGTRSKEDGECNAVRDHREVTTQLRAEVNALTQLLLKKRVFDEFEYTSQVVEDAEVLMGGYEKHFPGFKAGDEGMVLEMPLANETVKRMKFPP